MAFIDEIEIHASAGDGGSGVVRWRHTKGKEFSGPSGGDGGMGGSVYVSGTRDLNILAAYRHKKEFLAERGENGRSESQKGKDGADCVIPVPIGSLVTVVATGERYEILSEDERVLLLQGGQGGLGNEHFKSSVNQRPKESTPGRMGEQSDIRIELQLIADVGLVGLPNAGKSTLLNALTQAQARVGAYPFTTLNPNLGALYGFVLADIPGLIEGAAEGKGLGDAFLRHVSRTRIVAHCISAEEADIEKSYRTIRNELSRHDEKLLEKKEILVITKTDLVTKEELKKLEEEARELQKDTYTVSAHDTASLKIFQDNLVKLLREG